MKDAVMTKEQLLIKINQLEAKVSGLEKAELKSQIWLEASPLCTTILDLDFNLQYMSSAGINQLKIDRQSVTGCNGYVHGSKTFIHVVLYTTLKINLMRVDDILQ